MSLESRLRRKLQGSGGCYAPQPFHSAYDVQDFRRQQVADELAKLGIENLVPHYFSDGIPTAEEWYKKLAHGAAAAAEILYPELPDTDKKEE